MITTEENVRVSTIADRASRMGILMTAAQTETERLICEAVKTFSHASPERRREAWNHVLRMTKLRDPGFIEKFDRAERQQLDAELAELRGDIRIARDAFYQSRPWRALRYRALVKHGNRCQCCGSSAATGAVMHVDHVKPLSKYPELALVLDNLQVLCADCNRGKGSHDTTDWRASA